MNNEHYVVAESNGVKIKLFKFVSRNRDGSIYVAVYPGNKFSNSASLDGLLNNDEVALNWSARDGKISIHTSQDHPISNQIRFPTNLSSAHTAAVKSGTNFHSLCAKAFGNFSNNRDLLDSPSKPFTTLTSIDFSKDTLFVSIAVGSENSHFEKIDDHPSNLEVFEFGSFKIFLIWSLFNFPAPRVAINMNLLGGSPAQPIEGVENWEIYNLHTGLKSAYADAFFRKSNSDAQLP